MKKLLFILVFLYTSLQMLAQAPSNDDCSNPINLGTAPVCKTDIYSNVGATLSTIGIDNVPFCFNPTNVSRDVWFTFKTGATILDFTIVLTGVPNGATQAMKTPRFALYRGLCGPDKLAEVCGVTKIVDATKVKMDIDGLTPNKTYFIRVSDLPNGLVSNEGAFTLCVNEKEKPSTIDVVKTSTDCYGELYDSGGPNGPYKAKENYTLQICPTSKPKCITFALDYFNIDNVGDAITLYDGKTTTSKVIGVITANNSTFSNAGGGGVCYKVMATSGCLTVNFKSDNTVQLDGFKAHWECSDDPCPKMDVIEFNSEVTDKEMLSNLSTSASLVTLNKITCAKGAYGTFAVGDNNDLGIGKGIVLSSGYIDSLIGPNTNQTISNTLNVKGDAELDSLSILSGNKNTSNDACIVELDVFASSDEINFDYVFGSDEYPEFAKPTDQFNDIFAFLISGDNITNTQVNNKKNIAVLPNKNVYAPVEIQSVNNIKNWQYYRNNNLGQTVGLDGLTADSLGKKKTLTASSKVTPCKTYRLKLAVADRGDGAFDSAVFLSEIKGAAPEVSLSSLTKLDYLTEGCNNGLDKIIFSLYKPLDKDITYKVTLSGTAILGTDYTTSIPSSITFLKGETSLTYNIIPILDALKEGTETVTIKLSRDFGCGETELKTLVIKLRDNIEVNINDGKDTIVACVGGQGIKLKATGAGEYIWTGEGISAPNNVGSSIVINPTKSGWYSVQGSILQNGLALCTDFDSIYVSIIDVKVKINALSPTTVCEGDPVTLNATASPSFAKLKWGPTFAISGDLTLATQIIKPTFTNQFFVTASAGGCTVLDTLTVTVKNVNQPFLIDTDTICEGSSVKLTLFNTFNDGTKYLWTPSTGLSDATNPDAIATPKQTTTYVVKSYKDVCFSYDTVTIYVNNGSLKILGKDTIKICKGEVVTLKTQKTSTFPGNFTWKTAYKSEIQSQDTIAGTAIIKKQVSGNVIATFSIGQCEFIDTVYFKVDSLPSLPIAAIKPENPHCKGELITLVSPNVITPYYPNIKYLWTSQVGAVTPITNQNLAFYADKTLNYIRVTTNGQCKRSDTINIVVLDVTLKVSVKDTTVCEGTKFQVKVDANGQKLTDIKWAPETGLSCKDCLNPTVTASNTTTYTFTANVEGRCPTSTTFNVNVPKPVITIGPNPAILCKGASLQLDVKNFNTITNFKWTAAPDPISAALQNPVIKVAGTYTATGIVGGCPAQGSIAVQLVDPKIVILPNNPTICPTGGTTQLSAAGVDKNIVWTPSTGLNNVNILNPVASQAGTYTMNGTLQGCPASASVTIKVEQVPALVILPQNPTICPDGEVELTASGSNNNDYSWSPTSSFVSAAGNVVKATKVGTVSVSATYGVNKCPQTASVNVTSKTEDLISNAIATPTSVLVPNGNNVVLNVTSTVNNLNYVWSNNGQNVGNAQKIDVNNSNIIKGENKFTVTATNPLTKCKDFETVIVNGIFAQLPLAFNPYSTQKDNQVFIIYGAKNPDPTKEDLLEVISFKIYNRFGNCVYDKVEDDKQYNGWNGKMNNTGDEQPSDTYMYITQFKVKNSDLIIKHQGDVTLLK